MKVAGLSRIALGALAVAAPALPLRAVGAVPTRPTLITTRLLGMRYLAQGAIDLTVPHDRRLDSAVELLHAASMLPMARRHHPHAKAARLSAATALGLVALDRLP